MRGLNTVSHSIVFITTERCRRTQQQHQNQQQLWL